MQKGGGGAGIKQMDLNFGRLGLLASAVAGMGGEEGEGGGGGGGAAGGEGGAGERGGEGRNGNDGNMKLGVTMEDYTIMINALHYYKKVEKNGNFRQYDEARINELRDKLAHQIVSEQ